MKISRYWKRKKRLFLLDHAIEDWEKWLARRRYVKYLKTPRGKYRVHKEHARQRGVEWLFTFDSWFQFWQKSGHWNRRGNKKGWYVMARRGDVGPYSETNCIIVKSETNAYASAINSGRRNRSANYADSVSLSAIL